jgi:ABC-type Fe3+ transport system permease subunit
MLWAVIALVLPPFLVTNCWLDLLGQNGTWRIWLPFNLYSLGGAVWLLTLLTWPITTLLVLGAWNRLESPQLESDPMLRGTALLQWLLWPMARSAWGQAAVLTLVLSLNNFAVPVILQVRVFPEELWLAFTTRLDETGAWMAAWPMVVAPMLALFLLCRVEVSWPRTEGTATARAFRRQLGKKWFIGGATTTVLLLGLSVVLPLKQLAFSGRTWTELPNLFRAAPDTVWNSFAFAAMTATVCVTAGLVTWRARLGPILWLPFLIPGVLLGRAMIYLFNDTYVYGTGAIVVLAFTLRYLALGWTGVVVARRGVDRDVVDATRLDGASGWKLFRHAIWPQISSQLGVAWYVIYLLCLWDVETLVLIYPPGGETLALRIFNLLHYGHNAQVNALCVTLLALAAGPLVIWSAWRWMRSKVAE